MVEKYENMKIKNPYLHSLWKKMNMNKRMGGGMNMGGMNVNINNIIQKADELSMIIKNIRFKQQSPIKPENYIKDKNGQILLEIKEIDQNNVL